MAEPVERLEALKKTVKWHRDQAARLRAEADLHEQNAEDYEAMIRAESAEDGEGL